MKFVVQTLLVLLIVSTPCRIFAGDALSLKVAILAPEGTSWANSMKKMTREVKEKTAGRVELKIYYGWTQGDEVDVLRKIRVGQLHGGVFTGRALGEINGDVRLMEVPFTFKHDLDRGWSVFEKMATYFNAGFEKSGFKNLGFFELGPVYLVLNKKVSTVSDLNGVKIWSWEGDPVVAALIDAMKLVSVPLPLPDVLSSLSTGVVEAAYSPPLGIVALQWNTKIKYILDYPMTYSVGAFLVDKKQWEKLKAADAKVIMELCAANLKDVNVANRKENDDSLKIMKDLGVLLVSFSEKEYKDMTKYREQVIAKLKGKLFSEDAYNKFQAALK